MSDDAVDRPGPREVQDIDEIIPSGVQEQRMLVRHKRRGMVAVILIDGSHFKCPIPKGSDPDLRRDDSGLRRKGALVERNIKVKGAKRQNVEYGFLAGWLLSVAVPG